MKHCRPVLVHNRIVWTIGAEEYPLLPTYTTTKCKNSEANGTTTHTFVSCPSTCVVRVFIRLVDVSSVCHLPAGQRGKNVGSEGSPARGDLLQGWRPQRTKHTRHCFHVTNCILGRLGTVPPFLSKSSEAGSRAGSLARTA